MARTKICTQCRQVPMTAEEMKLDPPRCFWCQKDFVELANKTMSGLTNEQLPLPIPKEYGRTIQEVAGDRPTQNNENNEYSESKSELQASFKEKGFQKSDNLPDFSPRAKKILQEVGGLNTDKPQIISEITAWGNDGTRLVLELTAPIPQEWRKGMQKVMEMELEAIIRLLTYGIKHDSILSQILNMRGGPQW